MLAQAHTAVSAAGADGFTVKGLVVDSITGEGEPYATVRIENAAAPGKAVKMGVTQKDGRFTLSLAAGGKYRLTVSSMGRADVVKDFSVDAGKPTADLGKVPISDARNELAGVEVVAQKPLVTADIDKIGYDVESDPDSKTNTVMEMLRKVPMVTVDGEDNIKVNGSSSFKVYVNGRPNNMMSNNPLGGAQEHACQHDKENRSNNKPRSEVRRRGRGRHT